MKSHEKIRLFREAKSWTQEEMAEKLGLSPSGYAKLERGQTQLHLARLQELANIFGIDPIELLQSSESNLVCQITEGDHNQGHNYYSGDQGLIMEVEKLKLQLENRDSLLVQKDAMIKTQEEQIQTLKQLIAVLQKTEK